MDAATPGATPDDEIVTMELVEEPERKERLLTPERARPIFLALAVVAGVALVAAVLIIWLAPSTAFTWLIVALVVLVVVVLAEVALLILARPQRAS